MKRPDGFALLAGYMLDAPGKGQSYDEWTRPYPMSRDSDVERLSVPAQPPAPRPRGLPPAMGRLMVDFSILGDMPEIYREGRMQDLRRALRSSLRPTGYAQRHVAGPSIESAPLDPLPPGPFQGPFDDTPMPGVPTNPAFDEIYRRKPELVDPGIIRPIPDSYIDPHMEKPNNPFDPTLPPLEQASPSPVPIFYSMSRAAGARARTPPPFGVQHGPIRFRTR